jgi:hypothetical protein
MNVVIWSPPAATFLTQFGNRAFSFLLSITFPLMRIGPQAPEPALVSSNLLWWWQEGCPATFFFPFIRSGKWSKGSGTSSKISRALTDSNPHSWAGGVAQVIDPLPNKP